METRSAGLRSFTSALSRRPAVPAAAVFIGGIACHPALAHAPIGWITCAVLAPGIGVTAFRHAAASRAAVAAAIFFAGVAAAQIQAFYFTPADVAHYAADAPRLAYVELEFDQPLRVIGISPDGNSPRRPMPPRQVTNARVHRILTTAGWVDASGRTLVQIEPPNDSLRIGQTVRALGMLQRPSPAMNPGQFDWAAYYREQRILASIQIPHSDAIRIIEVHSPSPLAKARELVRRKLAAGFTAARSLDHALLRALVLGDNDPELRDVQEQFRRTGTSHHLAISGMHIAVLGALVYALCKLLLLRPRLTGWIAMTSVIAYGALALPSPPVVRSVLLCASLTLGLISRRSVDNLQLLALSVLAMLIYHPLDLYNAGFQLSFGTVLGLMLFGKRIFHALGGELTPDEQATRQLHSRAVPWQIRARQWLIAAISAGLVAWVVSMPLIAYHFEQLNPWAVIASLLLAPLVFLSLVGGFLKIVLTLLCPSLASAWAALAAAPVTWMRQVLDLLAKLPGSDVPLPSRSSSLIVVYYALLCVPLIPAVRPVLRRSLRLAPALAVMLLALLPLSGGAVRLSDGSLRVTILAVGAGQCAVVELPDGRAVLIDAGSATLTEPVRKCIAPFLRATGRGSIDEIWLSHGDFDHISAAADIIREYGVPRVIVGSAFENDTLMETIRRRNVAVEHVRAGDRAALGKDVTLDVLWPNGDDDPKLTSNNSALVLKLTYARRTILFPADIQEPAQAPLLRHPEQLHCDVLIAPHHGSSEMTTAAFVAAADPLYVVSSNDRTLTQKQRLFEKMIGKRPLFRTNTCGAVTITIARDGGLTVTPFLPQPPDVVPR